MRIQGTRFGDIELEDARVLELTNGMIGFPSSTRFVLLPSPGGGAIAWLQSIDEPALAFPVIDAAAFGPEYPAPSARALADGNGLAGEDIATFVVVVPNDEGGEVDANLLAPVIVDVAAGRGQQVVLDPKRYAARTRVSLAGSPAAR